MFLISRLLLLTPCYVIGLLCNNKDVCTYTILLTACLEVCFWMIYYKPTVLHMTTVYIHSWLTYGHGLFLLSYITLLVVNTTHICTCLILNINGGATVIGELLSLHSCESRA